MKKTSRFFLCVFSVFLFSFASLYAQSIPFQSLPEKAQKTVRLIQSGGPFPYPEKDGSVFNNFERRLPEKFKGYYREYTVPPPFYVKGRGAERVVAGIGKTGNPATSKEYYYTKDHYQTFQKIIE